MFVFTYVPSNTLYVVAAIMSKDIADVKFDIQESDLGTELLAIPFPFIGKVPSQFSAEYTTVGGDRSTTPWFRYYGRKLMKEIYDDITKMDLRTTQSMYYLHGTLGYGKSYILAVLSVALIKKGYKVVYLPDCGRLARSFTEYLKNALLLTYANDTGAQEEFLGCQNANELTQWCVARSSRLDERLYFVIDQLNVLDNDLHSTNPTHVDLRNECSKMIAELEAFHFLVFSGNFQHRINEHLCDPLFIRKSCYGGLSSVSPLNVLNTIRRTYM